MYYVLYNLSQPFVNYLITLNIFDQELSFKYIVYENKYNVLCI